MREGDELIAKILERFPVDQGRINFISRLVAGTVEARNIDPSEDAHVIGWKLMGLAPEMPDKIPGKRFCGLFNNPSYLSSTANWKRTRSMCRLLTEDNLDPDPYWLAWLQHCETMLAYRAMIPEKYRQWRPDQPREDFPHDDETPQEYQDRRDREAQEKHEARRKSGLLSEDALLLDRIHAELGT